MKKINIFLEKNIEKILYLFLFSQPIIDLLTSLSINLLHVDITFGIIVRMFFLFLIFYYYIFIMKNKKRYLKPLLFLIIYMFLFSTMIFFTKGTIAFFYEIKNMLRTFYFPLLLIMLYEIFQNKKKFISILDFVKIMSIYLLLIIIPSLTGTSFNGYTQGKSGIIGWFQSINEISAIFVGLMPFLAIYFKKEKNNYLKLLVTLSVLFVLFNLGSKIVVVSLLLIVLTYFICYLCKNERTNLKKIITGTILLIIISFSITIVLLPRTNFYKNIKIHLEFLKVEKITDVITKPELIDRFIFSDRLTFLNNTKTNFEKASIYEQLLGIGYIENYATDNVSTKLIEMDIFDIFYRHGLIGFIVYFYPVILMLKSAYKSLFENFSKRNCYEILSLLLAITLLLITSILAGHVLLSPAVSIYLTIFIIKSIKLTTTPNKNKV